jgi:hypothetical protein
MVNVRKSIYPGKDHLFRRSPYTTPEVPAVVAPGFRIQRECIVRLIARTITDLFTNESYLQLFAHHTLD